VQWKDFVYQGRSYDLSHLDPFEIQFERPAQARKPAVGFRVDVFFSLHCFSRRLDDEPYDCNLIYPNVSELRLFDAYRHELSKRLPDIVRNLPTLQIRQTGHGNYICVDVIAEDGKRIEYDVFFKVKKVARGRLELRIESAYVRDPSYKTSRPSGKPIRFWVILHNTLNGLAIRT
jgi:hypothetical protein